MKIDHDAIKEKYVAEGAIYGKACGKATHWIKQAVCDWLIKGGAVIVIFGPPGSGKSLFIYHLQEDDNTLILETSGVNIPLNSFLLEIADQIEFLTMDCSEAECIERINTRRERPLDGVSSRINLRALVKKWFLWYNSDWKWKLPDRRRISFKRVK